MKTGNSETSLILSLARDNYYRPSEIELMRVYSPVAFVNQRRPVDFRI